MVRERKKYVSHQKKIQRRRSFSHHYYKLDNIRENENEKEKKWEKEWKNVSHQKKIQKKNFEREFDKMSKYLSQFKFETRNGLNAIDISPDQTLAVAVRSLTIYFQTPLYTTTRRFVVTFRYRRRAVDVLHYVLYIV